ncbi:MAG: cytoplasmic protein [Desulfobacterales bacterium]
MAEEQENSFNFNFDKSSLYREESFTDLKVGTIRRLTPVKLNGSEDKSRNTIFMGQTSLMSPNGPVPLQAIIQAKEIQQAIKRFPEAMREAMDQLIEEAKKLREEEKSKIQKPESRIILPGK